MNPVIYLYDGHAINDTTNYVAWFDKRANSFYRQADGPTRELRRADNNPIAASIDYNSKTLTISIQPKGTWHSQVNTLNQWFDTQDPELKTFIIKDAADSNRQWYMMARPESITYVGQDYITLVLKVPDPIWRTVTENSEAWNITASGQTNVFTILGNRPVKPKITFKPTSAKVGGYAYRIFRAWYNPNTDNRVFDNFALDITNDAWDTRTFVADSSISNQINQGGGITAVATTIPIDTSVGVGLPTTGGVCMVDNEQIKYDSISAGVMTVSTGGRGWGATTAATHADNAVMKNSTMLADGSDIQVYVDKRKVSRWISGANTATTQVWITSNWSNGIKLTLDEAIANSGAVTSIKVKRDTEGVQSLALLERKGTYKFVIGSEVFTGTGVDRLSFELTGVTRAMLSSSMAAHAVGDIIYWMEHEIWICWGDLSAVNASGYALATQDETHKPIIDMDNSTNTSWKYLQFWDDDTLRAGVWRREVIAGRGCQTTGGASATFADPATDMGLVANVWNYGGTNRAQTYDIRTTLFHPAGMTTITVSGRKYRYSTDWPKTCVLYASNNLAVGVTVAFSVTTPSAVQTWQSWSESSTSLGGTYQYIQFRMAGDIAAVNNNKHVLEIQTITSIVIASATNITLAFSGAAASAYEIGQAAKNTPARLKNNTTGDYIDIAFLGELNEELEIDCYTERVTNKANNTRAEVAVSYPPREYMFRLEPGTNGENTLLWTDAGTSGMTVTLAWYDRNS